MSQDLPALWHAAATSPADRQAVARLLLDEVVATVAGDTDRLDVELRWAGGFASRHTLTRSVQTYQQLSRFAELTARVDELQAAGRMLPEIARAPNSEGFRPPKRSPVFTAAILSRFLREWRNRSGSEPRSAAGDNRLRPHEWWLSDLAAKLEMPIATLHRWQRVGWVTSLRACPKIPLKHNL